jgi:hypothetical protein
VFEVITRNLIGYTAWNTQRNSDSIFYVSVDQYSSNVTTACIDVVLNIFSKPYKIVVSFFLNLRYSTSKKWKADN